MGKKYQIFISSTYKDLVREREKVRDIILSMYHFPIGMEMFNAADEEQWEIIQETIDSSDYYVLIIGKRYGSLITTGEDAGMSYTEKEYRYAVSKGIPVLTFIKKDSAVTSDQMDIDPEKIIKLNKLVEEILSLREADWFDSVDDLGTKVSLALYKQFTRKKRPGWIRGDIDPDASLSMIVSLNQKVNRLETENAELKMVTSQRKPILDVSMQYCGTISNKISNPDEEYSDVNKLNEINVHSSNKVTMCRFCTDAEHVVSNSFSVNDFPEDMRSRITQKYVDEVNKRLPSKELLDSYNAQLDWYNTVQTNGHLVDFIVKNEGTAKATDIKIMMLFPQSIKIVKREDADNLEEPEAPELPVDPIEEIKAVNSIGSIRPTIKRLLKLGTIDDDYYEPTKPSYNTFIPRTMKSSQIPEPWKVYIDGKIVTIWGQNLLHTNLNVIKELCLIPEEKGIYKIQVSIMCSEYLEPQNTELELEIE